MIERIILDIKHSDDYTDYLFQTAALKNRRIIPMVGPSDEELDAVKDESTIIYRCEASFNNSILPVEPILVNCHARTITVFTHNYLREDGSIDSFQAEITRQSIDDNMELFRNPETGRILVDFEFCDTYNWYLEWWDPVSRTNFTEIIKWEDGFNEFKEKDLLACTIETACKKYCKGKWAGPVTVFDVLDRLSIIK